MSSRRSKTCWAASPTRQRQREMNDREQPFDAEARRRRLDALFADEPFLSPTMKARRLYEKLHELPGGETPERDLPEPPVDAARPRPESAHPPVEAEVERPEP